MADLYKGIAGSPITHLTADISANQTTISIADDSALPDGPNICTIGYGENLETIKYETKSNGVLQNVTRGIEGTPRAWPAGTEVARFFTAYDHNAIIENFTSHLAENSGKHITESGENENGRYIKFDDGTMIVYMPDISIIGDDSRYAQIPVPFPHLFNEIPVAFSVPKARVRVSTGEGVTTKFFTAIPVGVSGSRISNLRFMYGDGSNLESNYEFIVDVIAIGRWK